MGRIVALPKIISEKQGVGITARTTTKKSYKPKSSEENAKLVIELDAIQERVKQPWRGEIDWVETIRKRAEEFRLAAPKWDDDPEAHNEYFAARKTTAWYFKEMARLTHQIETEIKSHLGWNAVSSAMQLGELTTELRFKIDWEPAALFGDEQMGARKSGGEKNRKYQPEVIARFVDDLVNSEDQKIQRIKRFRGSKESD